MKVYVSSPKESSKKQINKIYNDRYKSLEKVHFSVILEKKVKAPGTGLLSSK